MEKFNNYVSNLEVLQYAGQQDLDNEFITRGIIAKFSVQFEFGWKILKELLIYEGCKAAVIGSPRGIIKEAYAVYPFFDGDIWLNMLKDRNDMTHIYDGNAAKELMNRILREYIPQFLKLEEELVHYYGGMLSEM